jgi:hypothetical protein
LRRVPEQKIVHGSAFVRSKYGEIHSDLAGGSCDALAGPDKERCLRQGGTVEVDARKNAAASAQEAAAAQ